MPWTYQQSTGIMSRGNDKFHGYSGNGPDRDQPKSQDKKKHGPLPQGTYAIEKTLADGGHMGPFVLPLTPDPENEMFHRGDFFIHGDNSKGDHSASDGCIILARPFREKIAESRDPVLIVIA